MQAVSVNKKKFVLTNNKGVCYIVPKYNTPNFKCSEGVVRTKCGLSTVPVVRPGKP